MVEWYRIQPVTISVYPPAVSTEEGTAARYQIGRAVEALNLTRKGPQRPLEHLRSLRHAQDALSRATSSMVSAARREGASWADIGRALEITRQAARQAQLRREAHELQRAEAKRWRLPLPIRRPRFRWSRRAA